MQINTSYQSNFSHYPKPQSQEELTQSSTIQEVKKQEQTHTEESTLDIPPLGEIKRQTYGLSILELMSDDEYRAFLRATANMTENEKIMAAQSLYRLSELYQGKLPQQAQTPNPYNTQDFLTTYQNAYHSVLAQKSH